MEGNEGGMTRGQGGDEEMLNIWHAHSVQIEIILTRGLLISPRLTGSWDIISQGVRMGCFVFSISKGEFWTLHFFFIYSSEKLALSSTFVILITSMQSFKLTKSLL